MLKFDSETTRLLDICYRGADVTRRRQASFDRLRPAPGDVVLDIGCGNGLLAEELARAVGSSGRVIGFDPSAEMRASAIGRCAAMDWVEIREGTAGALPLAPGSVDKAVSVQVFEYIDDVPAALREVFRVLRPGGRLVIGDIHFGSLVWHSDDPDRMARMVGAWDAHAVHSDLPARLAPWLREAGFGVETVAPHTICDIHLCPDGLASMMLQLMEPFAVSNGHVPAAEAADWAAEQRRLAEAGRFFMSVSHFVAVARKP